jgi:beta-N-acetylhexosaminidase
MQDEFEKNGVEAELFREDCPDYVRDYDMILYCTFCHQHKPCGALQIIPSWRVGALNRERSVVATFGSPYLINSNFPTINTAIAAYSDTVECQRAVARGIMGQLDFQGKLPVKLQKLD